MQFRLLNKARQSKCIDHKVVTIRTLTRLECDYTDKKCRIDKPFVYTLQQECMSC